MVYTWFGVPLSYLQLLGQFLKQPEGPESWEKTAIIKEQKINILGWNQTSTMVNFLSDAMSMVHFLTAMRYRLFFERLNIAIVAIIFLDHRERLFFDYFAHFEDRLFCDYSRSAPHFNHSYSCQIGKMSTLNSVVNST